MKELFGSIALLCCFCLLAQAEDPPAKTAEPTQEELERQFSEKMTGATLVGQFTVSNLNDGKPLAQDRYTLGKVHKLPSGFWSFEAHIQYGDKSVKLPLALPVKWAGDTPVITVTNVAFPGLGTYSARVLFYGDSYAGTWSGKDHGGEMWGRIIPAGQTPPPAEPKAESKPELKPDEPAKDKSDDQAPQSSNGE
jgi:hypothetical protein